MASEEQPCVCISDVMIEVQLLSIDFWTGIGCPVLKCYFPGLINVDGSEYIHVPSNMFVLL